MAETAVGLVVDHLIPMLTQEASLLRGIHSQVVDIKNELQSIQCFLRDADRKAESESDLTRRDGVKAWVEQLREVAFQIQDVIDEYMFHLGHLHDHGSFFYSIRKITRSIIKLKARHGIAYEIHDIKTKVRKIKERSSRYGFDSLHDQQEGNIKPTWYDPRKASIFLEEDQVVGIESDREKLVGWLVDKSSPQRTVVSVVGMGGLGKTTLAKQVYDRVVTKFDCHAWITVSESYDKKELLTKLMENFHLTTMESDIPHGGVDEEIQMISKIREVLKKKRYVIFFDDVWNIEFWSDIEHALLDNNKGGRIVITTRSLDVANFCRTSSYVHVHMLQPLPSEKARQLFCNRAFHFEFGGRCPPELENYSGKIVERCKGLPLAIVAIAGLLSTKEKTVNEWRKLHDNLSSELESNPHLTSISRILSLSYYDLPYYLKNCYLYFGMYPEDYSIKCSRLIQIWVSEGFITSKREKTLEEVAQEYLIELINRSLVQVSNVNCFGKPKECRIHDLLREMILRKMEDLRFGSHYFPSNGSSFSELTRRLMVHSSSHVHITSKKYSQVRSMLIFNSDLRNVTDLCETAFCAKFKLLKVLDFEATNLTNLPKDIGDLFHLKYLSVAHTDVQKLPSSMRKLQNLETLNLKGSLVQEVQSHQINRLHKLRHLFVFPRKTLSTGTRMYQFSAPPRRHGEAEGLRLFNRFGCLSLQTLYNVQIGDAIVELKKLTQLRELGISGLQTSHEWSVVCGCINEMKHLESLRVYGFEECGTSHLDLLSRRSSPERPQSLFFKQGMFQKLKHLQLKNLDTLNSLVIEEGALPTLELLIISFCLNLKTVPRGIQHLRNLKRLTLPWQLKDRVQPKGEDYHIVRHVQQVVFD
ncbi:hypothetical protein FNV43_RR01324 [Rhamnella rubrinervis]|uniref:Disease resistance protein RPM1-like n=1 Tax=Rhamnella rubrinervis TaxID=2594499 RepID=A0A8K0HQA3_9ROSA|nr:hypothetical protein FNV43_RR01324 [Rhamnella rubrinervis]